MAMKNPPHPGHSIKDACLEPLGLSVSEGAFRLGVARHTLSRVINGHSGLSPEMAIRLEKWDGVRRVPGWPYRRLMIWRRLRKAPVKLRYGPYRQHGFDLLFSENP